MLGLSFGVGIGFSVAPSVSEAEIAALSPAFLFNFADRSSLFVGRSGTGGNPAPGGSASIGVALDKVRMGGQSAAAYLASAGLAGTPLAAPGNHHVAPADNSRPVLAQAGGRVVCRTDGVDDGIFVNFPANTMSAQAYYAMAFATTDNAGTLCRGTDGNGAVHFEGSTATVPATLAVNGVLVGSAPAITRQDFLNAVAGGTPRVVEFYGVNHFPSPGISFFYNAAFSNLMVSGDCYALVGFRTVPTDAERDRVRRWLASLAGVSTS